MSEPGRAAAFTGLIDLAAQALGGEVLAVSDEFFAEAKNLLLAEDALFDPSTYDDHGKIMDGWESRRRRVPGHDWCLIKLGRPGRIRGVDIDTAHFLGNHPPFASIDATRVTKAKVSLEDLLGESTWTEILPEVPLRRGAQNLATVSSKQVWTHVILRIYPAGGVARLRLYGQPEVGKAKGEIDLAGIIYGGRAVACSDDFFSPMSNLLLPYPSTGMHNGWESKRSRPPGRDWVIVSLAGAGAVERVIVDTAYFRGNYPDLASIEAIDWPGAPASALTESQDWQEIVSPQRLGPDRQHLLPVAERGPWTHLRLRITPDGGVARFRAFGRLVDERWMDDPILELVNESKEKVTREALTRCCGSSRWVDAMIDKRPFVSRAQLFGHAEVSWWRLAERDWREAFAAHPRIGADVESLRKKFGSTAGWAKKEQSGVFGASEEVLSALAEGNRAYEERFGTIFIICATGLDAGVMLSELRTRLEHEPGQELSIAAGQQAKITRLRLTKLGQDEGEA